MYVLLVVMAHQDLNGCFKYYCTTGDHWAHAAASLGDECSLVLYKEATTATQLLYRDSTFMSRTMVSDVEMKL